MHHYRCQNVYITTKTSERIVDTLEFFPHNYQMPQLSSTDRLLVAAKDMTNAFQNPHPDVPFASVRFSNSYYNKLRPSRPQLRLPKSFQAQASFPHQPKS
jgi:hypothetical protein